MARHRRGLGGRGRALEAHRVGRDRSRRAPARGVDPLRLAGESYGAALGEDTRRAIERAESRQQGLALWLASPEFQRR